MLARRTSRQVQSRALVENVPSVPRRTSRWCGHHSRMLVRSSEVSWAPMRKLAAAADHDQRTGRDGPPGPYGTTLAAFNGASPNGTWKLYINDAGAGDSGWISAQPTL